MQLEKYYTCSIESRLHIPYNPASARLTTGLLILNALIQLKIIQYWWWFWKQWCRDVASGIDKHPDRTEIDFRFCRYMVIESSSLVPVLFREGFSHPYISFFHLLVNGFFCYNNNNYHNQLLQTGFLGVYWSCRYITYTTVTNFPGICAYIIGFNSTVWTKKSAKTIRKQK